MVYSGMFLDEDKQSKVNVSFFFLLFAALMKRKINFSQKYVIVITAIISLHYKGTN